jgi:hypothetical protein
LDEVEGKYEGITRGDQKTGVVGEFYSYLYLLYTKPDSTPRLSSNRSEKGWDIEYSENGRSVRVQVKAVSAFSTTRAISPIHAGWDQLFLLFLSRELKPEGFWIHDDTTICTSIPKRGLIGLKMRNPTDPNSGSAILNFGNSHLNELLDAINKCASMDLDSLEV